MSYTPYYAQWVDAVYDDAGNVVTPSPTPGTAAAFTAWDTALAAAMPQTAKGDLVTFDGSEPAVVTVGTRAGQVLTAAPSLTTGMTWALPLNATSVTAYGAVGDGSTDDTTAIQNAINAAAAGGTVYFPDPPGNSYRTSAPLLVPPNITLVAQHGDTLQYTGAATSPNSIKPLSNFTGAAVIWLQDKTLSGASTDAVGTRLVDITIDGTALPAGSVDGVKLSGLVREATFQNVTVRRVTGNAFNCAVNGSLSPQSLRFRGCLADNVGASSYVLVNVPDTTLLDCNSEGAGYVGFYIQGAMNCKLIGCRAEWSAAYGYYLTSGYWANGVGSGGASLVGCSSDRNAYDGVRIDATGAGQINIVGFDARRDGRNGNAGGGNYAGLCVSGATMPVIVNGLAVYPGVDDTAANNTTGASPQYGVRALNATYVAVAGADYVHAITAPFSDGGGNTVFQHTNSVGTAIGATNAVTRTGPAEPVNTVTASGAAQTIPDPANYPMNDITLTAACTLTFPTPRAGARITLALRQDATGGRVVTWPANTIVKWPGGTAPTLTTTAATVNLFNFVCTGSVWMGALAGGVY